MAVVRWDGRSGRPRVLSVLVAGGALYSCLFQLEVDGGVIVGNIQEIAAAGADTFVAGSAIFSQPDYKEVIDKMRAELSLVG